MSKPPKGKAFWDSCPTCGSYETTIIRESRPSSGYENTRRCEMCRYEWDTKVYDNDYLDAVYGGEVYDPMYHPEESDYDAEEYYVWHNDAYQQDHPELYPELFNLDDEEEGTGE